REAMTMVGVGTLMGTGIDNDRSRAGQERDRSARADQCGDNIDEFDRQQHRPCKLREREHDSGDERERPDFLYATPAVDDEYEDQRNEERQQWRLPSHHHADLMNRQTGDLGEHGNGQAQRAERDRAGIGDQANRCGLQRLDTDRDQQHRADRDRRTTAGQRFQQGAEAERDQHRLHALVGADAGEGAPQHVGVAAFLSQLEQPDCVDANPDDRKEADRGALERATGCLPGGHPVDENGDRHRRREGSKCCPARLQAQDA
ncbi:hypothetical protein KCU90_g1834, partial [Aureobasidium melanogenum]